MFKAVFLTISFYHEMWIFLDGGLRQLARLLVCNFRALEHGYGETESVLQTLRDLPIIPLADGRVVALSEEGVFFPVETQTKKSKNLIQTGNFMSVHTCSHLNNLLSNYNILNTLNECLPWYLDIEIYNRKKDGKGPQSDYWAEQLNIS